MADFSHLRAMASEHDSDNDQDYENTTLHGSAYDDEGIVGGARKAGLPPDALVYVGKTEAFKPKFEVIQFSAQHAEVLKPKVVEEVKKHAENEACAWVTLFGLHKTELVAQMGDAFNIHHLLLEDILDTTQRPTSEVYPHQLFVSLKMVQWKKKNLHYEQISIVLADRQVVLFQERPGDIFDGIRQRIVQGKGVIRHRGADYLLYRLIDTVVDQYFLIAEQLSTRIERLETEVLQDPLETHMNRLIKTKKQLLKLRRTILPLRDNVARIERQQHDLIREETRPYFRDVGDHINEVIEMLDMYRETVTSLIDLYMSSASNQMNQVMKVLTVIATIFIPLTFIVGIYGMNFDHMPELHYKYGYPAVWVVMIVISVGLLIFFRKKKWI